MRLIKEEINAIKTAILQQDPHAEIFLFGSRVNDKLKGGDIDLMVLSETLNLSKKITILVHIKEKIGDQKIDLKILSHLAAQTDPFYQSVKTSTVKL